MSSYTPLSQQRDNAKSVIRLRNCMPEKFFSFCLMHLSIILDLNDNSLEEILTDTKPRRGMTPLWRKKDSKSIFFGSQLTGESIASIFRLIEYLKRPENIEVEGLFRKTGSNARQMLLKEMLNKSSDLNLDEGQFSPHDCASVLKGFLKELPECLMVDKFARAHCQLCEMSKQSNMETNMKLKGKVLKAVQLLMLLLPEENTLLLECLLELLSKVVSENKNRMTSNALGTIFAPHLLCPKRLSAAEFHAASENFAELAAFIIDNADQVFQIPTELVRDIDQFWKDMENPNKTPCNFFDVSVTKNGLSARRSKSDEAVNTCVNFTDRSQGAEDLTQAEIAKLYEHIQAMPDTARKRKLLKKFSKTNHMNFDSCSRSSKENSIYQRFSQFIRFTGRQTRSRNLGLFSDTIKRHFPLLKQNKQVDQLSYGLPSASRQTQLTSTLKKTVESSVQTIEESFVADTPKSVLHKKLDFDAIPQNDKTPVNTKPPHSLSDGMLSPLVHVIELNHSPKSVRRTRKRRSSETAEAIIMSSDAEKTPVFHPPSIENEINYLPNLINKKIKVIPVTPVTHSDELPFFTPVTSFRRNPYRTIHHSRRQPFPQCNTPDTESLV